MTERHLSVDELIEQLPQLADHSELIEPLKNVFQFTQFLLDDDENLTRTGNLNAEAKRQLQSRVEEVFDMSSDDREPEESDVDSSDGGESEGGT